MLVARCVNIEMCEWFTHLSTTKTCCKQSGKILYKPIETARNRDKPHRMQASNACDRLVQNTVRMHEQNYFQNLQKARTKLCTFCEQTQLEPVILAIDNKTSCVRELMCVISDERAKFHKHRASSVRLGLRLCEQSLSSQLAASFAPQRIQHASLQASRSQLRFARNDVNEHSLR